MFPGDVIVRRDAKKAPPRADGSLADMFGAQAFGAQKLYREVSVVDGGNKKLDPQHAARMHAMQYTESEYQRYLREQQDREQMQTQEQRRQRAPPPGWAGIFDQPSSEPNFFAGPARPQQPATHHANHGKSHHALPPPVANAIAPHLVERIESGREMAKMALEAHETARALDGQDKMVDADASFRSAAAAYRKALEMLNPARRDLGSGPDSTLAPRMREQANLTRLMTSMLDNCEAIDKRDIALPSVPTDVPEIEAEMGDSEDSLLRRLTASVHTLTVNPKQSSAPKCFLCVTAPAEVTTTCSHYYCKSCSETLSILYDGRCPQCKSHCGNQFKEAPARQ
jgi:hypothetical protein